MSSGGLKSGAGRSLPEADAKVLRPLFEDIAGRLDRAPAFLNHRDYHSWNLFVHDREIRVIDFQDALLGPATYDLATLLNDRDTPALVTPDLEHRLVEYYYDAWHQAGGDPLSHDAVWHEYNLCLLQKACKVVGPVLLSGIGKAQDRLQSLYSADPGDHPPGA